MLGVVTKVLPACDLGVVEGRWQQPFFERLSVRSQLERYSLDCNQSFF